jgi:SAM-dependent methyltransferase
VTRGLRAWLAHPQTRHLDLDDPATTDLRRAILQEKAFLRRIYQDWYDELAAARPRGAGAVLEIGSGAGFLRDVVGPGLIRSERLRCAGVDVTLDGQRLPFRDGTLKAIVFTDVLHHLPQVALFFAEAQRTLRSGGAVAMVEPWVTRWSRFVYGRLHHEPFRPESPAWEFPEAGPLSGANGALPWMVFERDRQRFEHEFPRLRIERVRPFMPFRYLLSGGISLRSLVPCWTYPGWTWLEARLARRMHEWAMFVLIVLRRV